MTREERDNLRDEIKRRIRITDIYQPQKAKDRKTIICPLCRSGEHKDGAFKINEDNTFFKCFSCGEKGDVISLYRKMNNVDYLQALKDLGGRIDFAAPLPPITHEPKREPVQVTEPPEDRKKYFEDCREQFFAPDRSGEPGIEYLEKRGLDIGVCCDMLVGFDLKADPAKTGYTTPRIIIPTSGGHYIARRIDGKDELKVMNPKGVPVGFFNIDVLKKEGVREIFITEGAIDALSFLSVGADAIGLNSKDNANKFISLLEANRPSREITFIVALDNDAKGKEGAEVLAAGFRRLGLPFIMGKDLYGEAKDANEALCADREAFVSAIETTQREIGRPDNVTSYIDNFMGKDIEHFRQERKTGFPSFDSQTGGLYVGLYVLAAISSLGKTSWALQLADQLAAAGNDVLFFSLEMSRLELVSKSISRTIMQDTGHHVPSIEIRRGRITEEVKAAAEKYKATVGERLSVVEANFDVNISSIGKYVRKYIDRTGTRPTIVIDYLQILQPKDDDARKIRREALDNSVVELKRLSREIDAPIIVISSVNRANYATPIAYESLKESGGIEYSADCVLGMQLQCLNEPLFEDDKHAVEKRKRVKDEKNANPRKIEIVCLKNRFGVSSFSCFFEYLPDVDLFIDKGAESAYIKRETAKGRRVK